MTLREAEQIIATLERDDLEHLWRDTSADVDERLAAATEIGHRNARRAEAEHAAEHGRVRLRYGWVERRRGYRGQYVCLDCYRTGAR